MSEFSDGGLIDSSGRSVLDFVPLFSRDCRYISPTNPTLSRELLDRINEGGVDYVEVVDSTDSGEEGI